MSPRRTTESSRPNPTAKPSCEPANFGTSRSHPSNTARTVCCKGNCGYATRFRRQSPRSCQTTNLSTNHHRWKCTEIRYFLCRSLVTASRLRQLFGAYVTQKSKLRPSVLTHPESKTAFIEDHENGRRLSRKICNWRGKRRELVGVTHSPFKI